MFVWGLLKRDRVFQYPTIAGISWLVFFGVQALGAVRNPGKYPESVLDDGGLIIALIMLCLCAAAGWIGYYHAGRCKRSLRFAELSDKKIFWEKEMNSLRIRPENNKYPIKIININRGILYFKLVSLEVRYKGDLSQEFRFL